MTVIIDVPHSKSITIVFISLKSSVLGYLLLSEQSRLFGDVMNNNEC